MTQEKQNFDDLEAVRKVVDALTSFSDDERRRIIKWACEKIGMQEVVISGNLPEAVAERKELLIGSSTGKQVVDIKTFVEQKKPKNDTQFVAVVAYYYRFEAPEQERKEYIGGPDLVEATRKANWRRLAKPAQTLINTYLIGGLIDKTEQGYRINSVGENLVAMVLPNNNEAKKTVKKIIKNRAKKKSKKGK